MATSNSTDFQVSTIDIITEALQLCGVPDEGEVNEDNYFSALRTLNLMIKAWQHEGLFLHSYRDATMFFDKGEAEYLIGSTAHATESYAETTLSSAAIATDVVIALADASGVSDGDVIGVQMDDGTFHWTTTTTAATTLIADAMPGAAAAGNMVVAYTTAIGKPEKLTDATVKDASGGETAIEIVSREAYRLIPNKDVSGRPVRISLDPKTSYLGVRAWPVPSTVTDRLVFSYQKTVEDFDGISDTPDVPGAFSEALINGLAYRLAPKFRLPVSEREDLRLRAETAKAALDDFEETSIFIEMRTS